MADMNTIEQLSAMRAELQQLETARMTREKEASERLRSTNTDAPKTDDEQLPAELSSWLEQDGDLDPQAIFDELKEGANRWLDGFNEDLKDTRPSTLLLVFGLGVLAGKITS
ncbi:MAG: hypothetical protein ACR2PS_10885 [Pseudomonadales bacterium]